MLESKTETYPVWGGQKTSPELEGVKPEDSAGHGGRGGSSTQGMKNCMSKGPDPGLRKHLVAGGRAMRVLDVKRG